MRRTLVGRLMLAYTAVIAALLLSAWWVQGSLGEAERVAQRLSERSVEGIELTAKLERLLDDKSRVADYLLSHDAAGLAALRPHRQQFLELLTAIEGFVRTDEKALLARMRERYAAYTTTVDGVIDLVQQGRESEARDMFTTMARQVEELLADGQQVATLAEADMRARREHADATIADGRSLLVWLTGLGGLLSLAIGFVLSRFAARPISRLVLRLGESGVVDQLVVQGDEIGALEAHVGALLVRVRQQERALQQAEKLSELGAIASQIAHETLNPLAGVKGMLQALRRARVPAERLDGELRDMERELSRIEGIVRRLVRYARPLEPHMRRVSVAAVLDEAVDVARRTPAAHGRAIRVESATDGIEWVMDPELVRQVLVNLLVNGCEASPEGADVILRADVRDGCLDVEIRDHGPGIAAAERSRLFQPFYTTKPNGNGLGLAVSRNIVREHGGQIDVTTAVEGGAVFHVTLPHGDALCAVRS